MSEYIVKPGDTLYGIARALLGDGLLWPKLYEMNKAEIDREFQKASPVLHRKSSRITNPWDFIRPGQKLLTPPS